MVENFKTFREKYEKTIEEYGSFEALENTTYMFKIVFGYDMSNGKLVFEKHPILDYFFNGDENKCTDDELQWINDNSIDIEIFSPKTVQELMDKITSMGYQNISVFDGTNQDYITACIGIDKLTGRAVYNYTDMVEYLVNSDSEFNVENAIEWIDYNTIRALPYFENSPIIIDKDIPI